MNCNLPKITYPTLRTLLRFKLYEAISPQIDSSVKKVFKTTYQNDFDSSKIELLLKSIPLKPLRNDTFAIVYQSAIALKLSSALRRNAEELSYQILDQFQQKDVNFCQESSAIAQYILSDLTIRVVPPGLLQFELGDRGLSAWLQCLVDSLHSNSSESIPLKKPFTQTENSDQLFICQYSHARCCSLLRLAHESVITFSRRGNALDDRWIILTPAPIPWLTEGRLCLTHPAERALIFQLVTIVDDFSNLVTIPQLCLSAALALSRSFQSFHRACQIFELGSPSALQHSQTRLGLVVATQRLLRPLLEAGLGTKAPFEL